MADMEMEGNINKEPLSWFEFIFDETGNLLKNHLQDTAAEPSAAQLIVQFLERSRISPTNNTSTPEIAQQSENGRSKRLKQLALQVAYHLNWNLEALEENLSLQWQDLLFSRLLQVIPSSEEIQNGEVDLNKVDPKSAMALIIYHRWVIRTLAQHFLPNIGKAKNGNLETAANESILNNLKEQLSTSIKVLEKALALAENLELPCPPTRSGTTKDEPSTPAIPSLNSTGVAEGTPAGQESSEESVGDDSKEGKSTVTCNGVADAGVNCQNGTIEEIQKVDKNEIIAQVSYDLGTLYFYQEKFEDAAKLFQHCKESKCCKSPFYSVDHCKLHGYYVACCGLLEKSPVETISCPREGGTRPLSLLEQVEHCKASGYKDVIAILVQDNVRPELPMDYRTWLETEVLQTCDEQDMDHDGDTTKKDVTLAWEVKACNTIRLILEGKSAEPMFWNSLRWCTQEHLECLLSLCVQSLPKIPGESIEVETSLQFKTLKPFVQLLCSSVEKVDGLKVLNKSQAKIFLVRKDEKGDSQRTCQPVIFKPFVFKPLKAYQDLQDDTEDSELKCGGLLQKLRASFDAVEISSVIDRLHGLQPGRRFHMENFTCMLYKAYLDDVKDVLIQDLLHVYFTKAMHCSAIKEYRLAVNLLKYALGGLDVMAGNMAAGGAIEKVKMALHQELLVLDLKLNSATHKSEEMSVRVKAYIWQTGKRPDLLPSVEKHTVAYLLNANETLFLNNLMKEMEEDTLATDYRRLGALLATTCSSITKPQGWRKSVRQLWEGVLRVFSSTIQQKRPQDGPGILVRRDATNLNASGFMKFVENIKDDSSLGLLISCLVKLHNLSKEGQENVREIFSSYAHLWPISITNRNSVNFDHIDIALTHVTHHAISVDPHNSSWLHTLGDIYLDSQSFSSALKCYLEAGSCSSLCFTLPVPSSVWDEQVYKKMVRCCVGLKAHIQAALLCQCIEPKDYTTAFKALQQASATCEDSMDQYYMFFWDITMIEYLINTHSKRGQHYKKQLAIQAISHVELNMFNSPDVLQHAENIRKASLFRALAKRYL